jgi:hypothetical protein
LNFAFKATNVQNIRHQHQIQNSFLQRLCTSVTFSVFQQHLTVLLCEISSLAAASMKFRIVFWDVMPCKIIILHLCFANLNCNNSILYYVGYCHLAECNSNKPWTFFISHHSNTSLQSTIIMCLFTCELWASRVCIHFLDTLYPWQHFTVSFEKGVSHWLIVFLK